MRLQKHANYLKCLIINEHNRLTDLTQELEYYEHPV